MFEGMYFKIILLIIIEGGNLKRTISKIDKIELDIDFYEKKLR